MASKIHVKPKSQWKTVKIDEGLLLHEDLKGFPGLEILTDYELITDKSSGKKGQHKKSQDSKNLTGTPGLTKQNKVDEFSKRKRKKEKFKEAKINEKKTVVKQNENKNVKKPVSSDNGDDQCIGAEPSKVRGSLSQNQTQKAGAKRKSKAKGTSTDVKKQKTEESLTSDLEKVETNKGKEKKDMSAWKNLFVPKEVLQALEEQGFDTPTPIQTQVLPSAIRDRMDVLGAAETGSGKTLAFGIPLLHFILEEKEGEKNKPDGDSDESSDNNDEDLDETMEEEVDELDDEDDDDDDEEDEDEEEEDEDDRDENENKSHDHEDESADEELVDADNEGFGCVKVIKDVDFTWLEDKQPADKQPYKRKHPLGLILEPTRELAIQVRNHLQAAARHTDISIAVIVGGLSMQKQQRILKKRPDIIVATPGRLWELVQEGEGYLSEIENTRYLVVDEADRMVEKGHFEELSILLQRMNRNIKKREKRHTFVFSATLTLIHTGPQRILKKKKKVKLDEKQKLALLIKKIGLSEKPKVVDLTRKLGTVETLTEARINCSLEDKDVYMYYFLKRYPGRTLVFTNSKDCIRRLVSVFTLLHCNPLPLHADMHQRQRLKNLDRFTGNPSGLLLASDVAARGLDIPNVQHVLHYQVPHTVENYVHRSGRTARALKEGLSVMMIGPDDLKNYRKIIHTLNRNEDLPMFPVEQDYLISVRHRVNLVRRIETQEYRFQKSKRQNDWVSKAAEEMDIILDEDMLKDIGDSVEQAKHRQYLKQMKQELEVLLKQPILPRSFSSKYPTKTGRLPTINPEMKDSDAIKQVKKDKKVQDQILAQNPLKPKPPKPKKQKWKKKKNKQKH